MGIKERTIGLTVKTYTGPAIARSDLFEVFPYEQKDKKSRIHKVPGLNQVRCHVLGRVPGGWLIRSTRSRAEYFTRNDEFIPYD